MNEYLLKEKIEAMLKNVSANYRYTELNNEFIQKVLGKDFILNQYDSLETGLIISPTADYKLIIGKGFFYPVADLRVIKNDFEITDMSMTLDPVMTNMWQEGMVKTLPPIQAVNYAEEALLHSQKQIEQQKEHLYNILSERTDIDF